MASTTSNPIATPSPSDGQPLSGIDQPHTNDVLCGRGVTTNKWAGNEKFRSLVGLNKELYVTSTKRQKMAISRSIVEAVQSMNPSGRFLERDPATGLWSSIGDRKATEKTSQALRDGAAALRRQLSQDLCDPDFLSAVFDLGSSTVSSTKSSQTKEKEKPVKAKSVKKSHRRAQSMPDTDAAFLKKSASKKRAMETIKAPVSPRLSARNYSPARMPTSQPNSPRTESHFHASSPSPPLGEGGSVYNERRSAHFELPLRMGAYDDPTHRRRHTSHGIPTGFPQPHVSHGSSFPPPPASPRQSSFSNGYWNRPPMSPVGRWSPSTMMNSSPDRVDTAFQARTASASRSPLSFRACANSDHLQISMPVLAKCSPHPPLSPHMRSLSPRGYLTPPASPHDFKPPLSPRSFERRQDDVVLTANPSRSGSPRGSTSPTDVVVSNSDELQESSKAEECVGVEVVFREDDVRPESPLHGDKIEPLYLYGENPAADGMDMSPLPYDCYDQNILMEISDDLLRLPIAPVGHFDEGQ